jgi:hypothetical protein
MVIVPGILVTVHGIPGISVGYSKCQYVKDFSGDSAGYSR